MLKRQNIFLIIVLLCSLLFVSRGNVVANNNTEAELGLGLNLVETDDLNAIYDIYFDLQAKEENINMGFNGYYLENNFALYDLFTYFSLDFIDTYDTYLQLGFSQYDDKKAEKVYKGLMLGSNFENVYSDNMTFFTNLRFSLYSEKVIPRYKIGLSYKINEFSKINLSYNRVDSNNSGLNINFGFMFDSN